jgi:Uma2 family endonuclease
MAQAVQTQVRTRASKGVSLEAWMRAYDRHPVEVVDGEFLEMSPNQRAQGVILSPLLVSLYTFALRERLGQVFTEIAFVLDGVPRKNWVRGARQPDLAFIAQERVEQHNARYGDREGPWWLAPDLAVEIVSPTDAYSDVNRKIADYLRYGVRLVWIIDPQMEVIRIYTPDDPEGRTLAAADTLDAAPLLPGWTMLVSEVFHPKTGASS